jgi:predicted metalloprotease with PDZ domain
MVASKTHRVENKRVKKHHKTVIRTKKRMSKERITLNVYENKGDTKSTTSNSRRTLNVQQKYTICGADRLNVVQSDPRFQRGLQPRKAVHGGGLLLILFCFFSRTAAAAQPIQCLVDLRAPEAHFVQVAMHIPDASPGTEIQIPTWNCLYQIRDFVKNVEDLRGDCDGQPADLSRVDLNTWRGPNQSCHDLAFHYSVYADSDGPFDSMLNGNHSFLNLAMVLFHLPRERSRPIQVKFQLPTGWKLATLLGGEGEEFQAANYDALVDSPVEAGHFEDFSYQQDFTPRGGAETETKHATIRLIIDADRDVYSPGRLMNSIHRVTEEETRLMQDLPFSRYTFILHFPRDGGSTGGMEHRDGAAIAIPASQVSADEGYLESVVAHEFFHLWNVKRIRPQSLEPVDYVNGNDTRDMWLCEGVTNTYAQLVLLRAGLIDRATFFTRFAGAIQVLQDRSARRFQSVETAGREAWLEKYSGYNRSGRSISYYNKGELLGYLLDLGIRHASANQAGLDDVMRRLNQDYARQGRFYTLGDFEAIIAQLAPAFDMSGFLRDYVRGTKELDYSTYLGYAGLELATHREELPQPGFSASRNAGGLLQIDSVDAGSDAQRAGLQPGDLLMLADGEPLPAVPNPALPVWRPGQLVELQIAREGVTHVFKFRIGVSQEISMQIQVDLQASPEELRVREGWLKGVTNASAGNR